jgi:DNA-binding MarR family transcriptional regulator
MPYNIDVSDRDETITRFRAAYWAVIRHVDALRLQVWEERGLTLPQLRVLFYVRSHPGTTTNALATQLGLTAATVSGLVDKLTRNGLIERLQHPEDRRVIPLCLTADGQAVVGEIRQGNRAYLSGLADYRGDDLEPITAALERLAEAGARLPAAPETAEVR